MSNIIDQVLRTNIYIQPVHFVLAIITNILNIRVLCSRVLRSSPCTHYFLAYAIFSILYACLLCPTQMLRGFDINWANEKLGCKIHFYILFLIPFQANVMLVLASFDRYYSSCQSLRLHSTSTIRTTRIIIAISTLLSVVYMLPMLSIYHWHETSNRCLPKANLLINIYVFSQVFLYYILAPLTIFLFGLLTIIKIRQQSTRAAPLKGSIRGRRTEGQLARMLILQITVHLILVLPFGVIYLINSFKPSTQTSTVIAVRLVFITWQQCDYFVSFFLYVFSGSIYRQQLIRIFKSARGRNTSAHSFVESRKDVFRKMSHITVNIQTANGIMDNVPV